MASCFSLSFLGLFLPLALILYQLTPKRHRPKMLLAVSLLFFILVSKKLIIFLLAVIISVYVGAILLETIFTKEKEVLSKLPKEEKKAFKKKMLTKRRMITAIVLGFDFGILLVLKYAGFFAESVYGLASLFGRSVQAPVIRFLLPIGISFYTMQAASYLFDVYRKTIPADHNFFRVALFLSFFPQMTEGPICRYSQTANALWEAKSITWESLTFGLQRILYGLLKKTVIADRLNLFIATIFNNYASCDGSVIAVGMICYTCQLYMDFSGAMDVVIGISEILGITMPENFRQPFFSRTISEFWTRWHISLGAWFRDYLFYPLSMSKPLKKLTSAARKKVGNHFGPLASGSIALFCVWFSNGLWHGAGWNYIFFGLYHFFLILMGSLTEPFTKKLTAKLQIERNNRFYHLMQILRTVLLVNIGELFFRANSLHAGLSMFSIMITRFSLRSIQDGILLTLAIDLQDFFIVAVSVLLVFMISILHEKGISVRHAIAQKPLAIRWAFYYAFILFAVIFGAYGVGYLPVDPIYANF